MHKKYRAKELMNRNEEKLDAVMEIFFAAGGGSALFYGAVLCFLQAALSEKVSRDSGAFCGYK